MRHLIRRLNDLPIFDAARWPAREVVGRILGSLAAVLFIASRILQLPNSVGYLRDVQWPLRLFESFSALPRWLVPPPANLEQHYFYFGYSRDQVTLLWRLYLLLWTLFTGCYLAYLLAYLTRAKAQKVASGFMQTVFPVVVAALPFLIQRTKPTYLDWFPENYETHMTGLYVLLGVLIAGASMQLLALLTLRRGFTIMSEARVLIRSGIYRWVRHPVYSAHFLIYLCYMLYHFHAETVALYIGFVAGQTLRARIEERKLSATFPEYEEYRKTAGMFFPRLWKTSP